MPALDHFSPSTREWFTNAFAAPTPAQEQAWPVIASGEHVLISAPTGSGKTLAAFLDGIDRLATESRVGGAGNPARLRLAAEGALIRHRPQSARAAGAIGAEISVAVRTGDTPQKERQAMLRQPPDILDYDARVAATMLTGRAQELFAGRGASSTRSTPSPRRRRRPPRAHPRAAQPGRRRRGSADRPQRDPESARGGWLVHGRAEANVPGRQHGVREGRPPDPRPG